GGLRGDHGRPHRPRRRPDRDALPADRKPDAGGVRGREERVVRLLRPDRRAPGRTLTSRSVCADEFSPRRSSKGTDAAPRPPRSERIEAMHEITPCLWFDTEGEEAANFYTSVFPNSRIVDVARFGSAGPRPEGTVMTVSFELDGQKFVALNG